MLRATLIARRSLPAALDAMTEAATWLSEHGATPSIETESARAAQIDGRWERRPRESLARDTDVVIAFGGDGTLLDAANAVAHGDGDAPLMGVNLGRLGFLTDVGRDQMFDAFADVIAGRTRTETRLVLEGCVERRGAMVGRRFALNDIVVTRGALSRMIEMTVTVDDQFVCAVKADGLIVASATGSTAYNLSAGGPVVHPGVDAFVLTPIAPHTLTHRPLVLPAGVRIELRPIIEPQSDIVATFDGQHGQPLMKDDVVRIGRAPRVLKLLRVTRRSHYDVLREKLKWGYL